MIPADDLPMPGSAVAHRLLGARLIRSSDNPHWREVIHCAQSSRERRKRGYSFLEGEHLCEAWLHHVGLPHRVVLAESALVSPIVGKLVGLSQGQKPAGGVLIVEDALWRDLSQLVQGVSIAFLIQTPQPTLPEGVADDAVYLDRLQDPGNVGSILRSAAAAGIPRVLTAPGTAFAWAPKVLRAGMGAHFALSIHEGVPWPQLAQRAQIRCLGSRVRDARPIWEVDLRSPSIWLFGNEGGGLDPQIEDSKVEWVRIPQSAGMESLNVAAAAAICLFEQSRQRNRA